MRSSDFQISRRKIQAGKETRIRQQRWDTSAQRSKTNRDHTDTHLKHTVSHTFRTRELRNQTPHWDQSSVIPLPRSAVVVKHAAVGHWRWRDVPAWRSKSPSKSAVVSVRALWNTYHKQKCFFYQCCFELFLYVQRGCFFFFYLKKGRKEADCCVWEQITLLSFVAESAVNYGNSFLHLLM